MHLPTVMTNKIIKQQADVIRVLMDKPEDDIDTQERPEMTDWTGAERGKFSLMREYSIGKRQVEGYLHRARGAA